MKFTMRYSVVIPVYNRPDEVDELLQSLTKQTYKSFEVLIIEDGSTTPCKEIVDSYRDKLDIHYYFKENSGQGFSRNFGFERSNGDYLVVFDSDCLIPSNYFHAVNRYIENGGVNCWGGPDSAHSSFTHVQKAINYSMTSLFSTGGIRGRKKHLGKYHPRSFNMGISREVWEKTNGYRITRMGEDIEFSIRIQKNGFNTILIEEAYVYHKRRTSLKQFAKQLHFFGRARVNIWRFYPKELKALHFLPLFFLIGLILTPILSLFGLYLLSDAWILYAMFAFIIALDALRTTKNLPIALLATLAVFIQLSSYGLGFAQEWLAELKE